MNLDNYILKNGLVFIEGILIKKDILIRDGIIIEIADNLIGDNLVDVTNKIISYGFCDMHVHLRTPGFMHKEDLKTGSMAALHGGYTSIATMPNTNPVMDNVDTITSYLNDIRALDLIEIRPFSAASKLERGQELVALNSIAHLNIAGFSDDGKGLQDASLMKELLIKAGALNKLVSMHCEDEKELNGAIGCMNEGYYSQKYNVKGINKASEYKMIERDLNIIKEIHNHYPYSYHVNHISCQQSLDLIKEAKALNHHVTCEVTPHHLISDDSWVDISNANYKMNPPLRDISDVNSLVAGLNDGSIDVIATDHAPHSISEKDCDFTYAPFGIIGLETSFSLLNTYLVKTNKVKIETILKALIDNPRKLLQLDYKIKEGSSVNLNIIDLNQTIQYNTSNTYSKSANTFYYEKPLIGQVISTIIKNKQYHW
ncbi:MAG: dihydroorotase [Bacilli bacterium]